MNSINLVEAALESTPQLLLQAYVFFKIGGDPRYFSGSALIGIGTLLRALYIYVTTSETIKNVMSSLRTFFAPDAVAAASPVIQPPPSPPIALPPPIFGLGGQ